MSSCDVAEMFPSFFINFFFAMHTFWEALPQQSRMCSVAAPLRFVNYTLAAAIGRPARITCCLREGRERKRSSLGCCDCRDGSEKMRRATSEETKRYNRSVLMIAASPQP